MSDVEIKDKARFAAVVAEAKAKAELDPQGRDAASWHKAIDKAAEQLLSYAFLCSYDAQTQTLTVLSRESHFAYKANGTCKRDDGTICPARVPCWHRIAKRLYLAYLEAENQPQTKKRSKKQQEQDDAPYFQAAEKKTEKVGGCIRI